MLFDIDKGENEGEGAAFARFAGDEYLAVVEVSDKAADSQSQAGACPAGVVRFAGPVKTVEDIRQMSGSNPGAGILNADFRPAVLSSEGQSNRSPGRRIPDGIVDEIEQQLSQLYGIA